MGIYARKSAQGVTYYAQYWVEGQAVRESLRTGHKAEAEVRYKALMERVRSGEKRGVDPVGSLQWDEAWRLYERSAKRDKRARTIEDVRLFWRAFWAWTPKTDLYRIARSDALAFQDYLRETPTKHGSPRSPHTVNDTVRAVGNVFSRLKSDGVYRGDNHFTSKSVPPLNVGKPRPKFLERDEIEAVLARAEEVGRDIHLVYALGIYAGLRKGEILALRWRDLHFERADQGGNAVGCLYVWDTDEFKAKTHESNRVVPLHPRLAATLRQYEGQRDEYVVAPGVEAGGKRYRWEFRRHFAEVAGAIEKHLHPHMLRHTFGSQMVMAGVSIYKVSRWMGHSSVTTTEIYAHLSPADSDIARMG